MPEAERAGPSRERGWMRPGGLAPGSFTLRRGGERRWDGQKGWASWASFTLREWREDRCTLLEGRGGKRLDGQEGRASRAPCTHCRRGRERGARMARRAGPPWERGVLDGQGWAGSPGLPSHCWSGEGREALAGQDGWVSCGPIAQRWPKRVCNQSEGFKLPGAFNTEPAAGFQSSIVCLR